MRTSRLAAMASVGLALVTLCARPSFAQGETGPEAARAHLDRGKTLLNEGDFARAVLELEAAQKAQEDPRVYFLIGQCYRAIGEARQAVRAYSQFVEAVPKARERDEAKRQILALTPLTFDGAAPPKEDTFPPRIKHAELQKVAAWQEVTITAEIEDQTGIFEPTLYYRTAGAPEFTPLPLKQKDIHVYAAPIPPQEPGEVQYFIEAFDTLGNGPTRDGTPSFPHAVKIEALSAVARKPKPTAEPIAQERDRLWTWIALGAGGVAALVGGGMGLGVRSIVAADHPTTVGGVVRHTITESQAQTANNMAVGANILFVVAGLALGGGGVLFFIEPGMGGGGGAGAGVAIAGSF